MTDMLNVGSKIMDNTFMGDIRINRLRRIRQRKKELLREFDSLDQEEDDILELSQGARKSSREMLTKENKKALFAGIRGKTYEYSKAQ